MTSRKRTWRHRRFLRKRLISEHFRIDGRPKKGYSLAEAKAWLRANPKANMTPYQCSFCDQYHVGHRR